MKQLAVFHTEPISRMGEIKYFQIPLPGTIKNITAVEVSGILLTNLAGTTAIQNPGVQSGGNGGNGGSNCPNPGTASIDAVSDTTDSTTHEQSFRIGAAVNPGFTYSCGVYSVVITVTATDNDTPDSIATKMANAVNSTSLDTWNQYGSNNLNYKPSAQTNGDVITLFTDRQHSFFASASGSCSGATPQPLNQYDLLFAVGNSEKLGTLSLQSPDATDIFYQCEGYREDKNIGFGDFTLAGEMMGEWLKGGKRYATDINITTASPIIEAYYKDCWGAYWGRDVSYQLNILIWFQKPGT